MKPAPPTAPLVEIALQARDPGQGPEWAHVSGWMDGLGGAWTVSCVVHCKKKAAVALSRLLPDLSDALTDAGQPWEVLIVDTGADRALEGLMLGWGQLPGIRWFRSAPGLSRSASLWLSLERTRGNVVVVIDPLRSPSLHLLPQMLARWECGARLVSVDDAGQRTLRSLDADAMEHMRHDARTSMDLLLGLDDLVVVDRSVVLPLHWPS